MNKVKFSRFRNSDYSLLATQLVVLLGKYNEEALTALSLKTFLTLLENRQGAIDLALDKNRKNPHTAAVEDCDEKRDDALLAFKYFIQYCAKQPDLSIRQAAELLIGALQTFGWSMQSESNSEQSKQVKSFIAEVDNQTQLSTVRPLQPVTAMSSMS